MKHYIIRDTAGQEDFKDLRTLAYRNADVFIITFAVDNPNSFENANKKVFLLLNFFLLFLYFGIFIFNKIFTKN